MKFLPTVGPMLCLHCTFVYIKLLSPLSNSIEVKFCKSRTSRKRSFVHGLRFLTHVVINMDPTNLNVSVFMNVIINTHIAHIFD
jgi:hypothetical protein